MKRMILPILISCLIASSVHAVPLTWDFRGTTISRSELNGTPIVGLAFELRIFLDTNLVGREVPGLSDVFFDGPHVGEVEIEAHGVLPVGFQDVEYFVPSGSELVTGVQFTQVGKSFILFPSSISSDPLHLTAIAPTAPNASSVVEILGPNDLDLFGEVATFSATSATTVPEAGSTALLLTSALVALGFLRWRRYGSAS
jgi:hypothetical protein